MKKYLAERLQQFQESNEEFAQQVSSLSESLSTSETERQLNKVSLDTFVSRQETTMESLTVQFASEKTTLTSDFHTQVANLQRDQSVALRESQEQHEAITSDLRARCEKLESERADLMENRAMIAAEKMQVEAAQRGVVI